MYLKMRLAAKLRSLFFGGCFILILFFSARFFIFNRVNAPIRHQRLETFFVDPLTPRDKDLLDRTLRAFIEAVETANLTYFIIGGALIGSLRHHNRVPWDDDVDVIMNVSDKFLVEKALSKLYPDYGLSKIRKFVWKLYPTVGRYVPHYKHRSPNIDVCFFAENETHIWNNEPGFMKIEVWLKQRVFPLHRRPYGNLSLAAPCSGLTAMGPRFNIGVCSTRIYSHIVELFVTQWSLPCDRLRHLYPFVSSHQMNGSLFVQETLMFGSVSLRDITTRAPC